MSEDELRTDEAGRASRYSLAGVRGATMERLERLVQRAVDVFRADDNILAGYVVGSLATDDADPWTDVDLRAVAQDKSRTELVDHWRRTVDAISPTVSAQMFGGGQIGGLCITPDWLHFDLVLNPRSAAGVPALAERGLAVLPTLRPDRTIQPTPAGTYRRRGSSYSARQCWGPSGSVVVGLNG